MSREAWGRWGAADEIGAVNLIDAAARLRAVALVQTGQVVSLGQVLDRDTPNADHRIGIGHFMGRDGGDYAAGARRPGGFQFAEDTVVLPTHAGTHLDALCHVWYDDQLYNGHSAGAVRSKGAARCGIETIPPIVTRGVLLDVTALRDDGWRQGEQIDFAVLRDTCKRNEITIGNGDAVLIRTGWLDRAADLGPAFFDGEPGLDISGAEWLADAGAAVIGADNFAIEAMPFNEGQVFPVHQRLLRDFGIPLLEGMRLGELARAEQCEFFFCCAPLPIRGGTASPVHPFAVL